MNQSRGAATAHPLAKVGREGWGTRNLMIEVVDERRSAPWELLLVVALLAVSYLCVRTLRFTNDWFNLAFVCAFFVIPLFGIRPALRLHGWRKALTIVALAPLLAISLLGLFTTLIGDLPAVATHREMSRELSTIQEENYSVHLLWQETPGGAVGPHGVGLEQRMFIAPGLYVVKQLDYFEGAHEGSISSGGPDKIRLQIPKSNLNQEVDKVYNLNPKVYF